MRATAWLSLAAAEQWTGPQARAFSIGLSDMVPDMRRLYSYLLLLASVLLLAACGGGGGGGGTTTPTVPLVISSISPLTGAPGASLTVTGTGLSRVTTARLGGAAASFTIQSDTSLQVVIPGTAVTGVLELSGGGSAVQSSQTVTVQAPAVTSINPSNVAPGGRIVLSGSFLDQVASVRLGTVALNIVAKLPDSLTLDVPNNALSGFPVLVLNNGIERTSAVGVTILQPLAVSAISPAAGIVGASITLTGNGLDRVNQVFFGSAAAAPSTKQNNQLTVVVPVGATTGALRLVVADGSLTTTQSFRVAPIISVSGMTPTSGLAGSTVTITGSGFSEVSGVALAGVNVTISNRSDTQIQFTVPTGTNGGAVALASATQATVVAGSFSVTNTTPATVARIDFVQTYSQQASDSYQRLAPGKPAVVRAYVLGTGGSPSVSLVVRNGSTVVATLPMTGPGTLPSSQQPYNLAQTFNATLTGSQVVSGLNVVVTVNQTGGGSLSATPVMGSATNLKLVLVPLQAGSSTAVLPTATQVRQALLRTLPFADASVQITARSPYMLTSVSAPPQSGDDWPGILSELEDLRGQEAPTRHYYGFVPRPTLSGAQTVGLGYQNGPGLLRADSAIGLDTLYTDWERTMVHELGHNFSRGHAPCGNPGSVDTSYPYANGVLSSTPLYNNLTGTVINPSGETDVMGYCGGSWFSDYNYRGTQTWLEGNGYPLIAGAAAETDLLRIRGYVDAAGVVHFAPLSASRGQPVLYSGGSHVLRLTLANGSVQEQRLRTVTMPDSNAVAFNLAVPYVGELAKLEVLQDGRVLPQASTAQADQVGSAGAPSVDWREAGGELRLSWNAAAYPRLSVTHVGSERTVLSLGLTGGSARISLAGLPEGGRFEFSLGRTLDARVLVVKR